MCFCRKHAFLLQAGFFWGVLGWRKHSKCCQDCDSISVLLELGSCLNYSFHCSITVLKYNAVFAFFFLLSSLTLMLMYLFFKSSQIFQLSKHTLSKRRKW